MTCIRASGLRRNRSKRQDDSKNGDLPATHQMSGQAVGSATARSNGVCAAVRACLDSGCVYRRLIVRSDPPGARVLIDGQEVGYTPTGIPFTYYGTRTSHADQAGIRNAVRTRHHSAAVVSVGADRFCQRQFPSAKHVADRHDINWQLSPQTVVPLDQLQQRADSLRSEAHMGQ